MKRNILSIISLVLCAGVFAQSNDEIIFKAMNDELQRNMNELKLDQVERPSFISYVLFDGEMLNISSSLGEVVSVRERPIRNHGVKVLLGDYSCTSDCSYNGIMHSGQSAIETDYDQLRREYWLTNDFVYKRVSTDLVGKIATRKQKIMTEEEQNLPDFLTITPINKIVEGPQVELDRAKWENNMNELSAIFGKYKNLYKSSVTLDANDFYFYVVTSEGTVVKQPMTYASISMKATVCTEEGVEYSDAYEYYATSDLTLPPMEQLSAMVDEFAGMLSQYATAPVIEEFYSGPVLIRDNVVANAFTKNLVSNTGLLASRKAEEINTIGFSLMSLFGLSSGTNKSLENRIGQRILDKRFSVKNLTSMKSFDGVDLLGYYQVDAEGVIPEEELILIDSGMMRGQLNGRVPTLKSKETTGSQRFGADERKISTNVAPGTLMVSVNGGQPLDELETELIRLAKEDGLKYAYIVTKSSEGKEGRVNYIYRIDAETGVKTLVRRADTGAIALGQLKKVAGISDRYAVTNFMTSSMVPASIIYPNAILLENVEISERQVSKSKAFPTKNPTERSVGK